MVFDESIEGDSIKELFNNGNTDNIETDFNELIK